jgi:hypothetical protein
MVHIHGGKRHLVTAVIPKQQGRTQVLTRCRRSIRFERLDWVTYGPRTRKMAEHGLGSA